MPDIIEARGRDLGSRTSAALEQTAFVSLLLFAAALQVSIAAAQALLALTAVLWIALIVSRREKIDVPSMFIAGRSDWGAYQNPGALERMQKTACTRMLGVHFVDGAGHWVQQEQPGVVSQLILQFLKASQQKGR